MTQELYNEKLNYNTTSENLSNLLNNYNDDNIHIFKTAFDKVANNPITVTNLICEHDKDYSLYNIVITFMDSNKNHRYIEFNGFTSHYADTQGLLQELKC